MNQFKGFLFLIQVMFMVNCVTDRYTKSFESTDADKYMYMSNETIYESQALFNQKLSSDGKGVILESGNFLIPKHENGVRVLKLEMKKDSSVTATDYHVSQFKTEKNNSLYFIGFDTPRLFQQSTISQTEPYGESDQVDINFKEGVFTPLSVGDKISIQLNSQNQHKLVSSTIDLYQIQLNNETIVFYWKLKKEKGNQYVVESTQKYSGQADIQRVYRSKFKYYSTKTFYYLGKTGTILVDVVTFPIQIPYWIVLYIGALSLAR